MKTLNQMTIIFLLALFLGQTALAVGSNDRYEYHGLEGKISNLTDIPNKHLRMVVRICKFKWTRKCSNKFIKSKISADGSYKLVAKKTGFKWSDELYIHHYIQNIKTKEQYQLVKKLNGRVKNLSSTKKNFTLIENFPKISGQLYNEDGTEFIPEGRHTFVIASIDALNGEENNIFAVENKGSISIPGNQNIHAITGYIKEQNDFKLKLLTYGETENTIAYRLNKTITLNLPFDNFKQAIESNPVGALDITNSVRAGYAWSKMFHEGVYGAHYYPRYNIKGEDRQWTIKNALFDCHKGLATADVKFDELGELKLKGACSENGQSHFSIDQKIKLKDGKVIHLVADFNIRITEPDNTSTLKAELIDASGELIAKYKLFLERFSLSDFHVLGANHF
ncbi:MAG: hypothetical protein CME62_04940 [Halobacteriovoraceae bacterium]|nr:hypothetical protein [Halobacteriovoraceae bacterium]|tara:strand:+ start:8365 stop:9546 length:1182 start_codon:yes stop_codon:yes gene_type:complete